MIEEIEASEAVVGEFRKGFAVHSALAAVRQERVNAASRALESRLMDGIGQLTHRIDADFYWAMRARFGDGCWSDKSFMRDCVKRGAVEQVRGRSDKISLDMGRNIPIGPARSRRVDLGMKSHGQDAHATRGGIVACAR